MVRFSVLCQSELLASWSLTLRLGRWAEGRITGLESARHKGGFALPQPEHFGRLGPCQDGACPPGSMASFHVGPSANFVSTMDVSTDSSPGVLP